MIPEHVQLLIITVLLHGDIAILFLFFIISTSLLAAALRRACIGHGLIDSRRGFQR